MSNIDDAVRYSRAIECANIPNLDPVDIDSFLKISKDDWNLRAIKDASKYVCASSLASEEDIRASGYGDVKREFLPRVFPDKNFDENSYIYPVDTVLEIGCGFGRMTMFIAPYCKTLYAVDISSELLRIASSRLDHPIYQHVHFIETDGMHLDGVPNNSVDIAFEYIVFQHCSSEEVIMSYIREVGKKLKIGGMFIMHGRDVPADTGGISKGNTWHGCQCGGDLVRRCTQGTMLQIVKEEGVGTDRYWVTLRKVVS